MRAPASVRFSCSAPPVNSGRRWRCASPPNSRRCALARGELDLRDARAVRARVAEIAPRAIVNCAGFNQVDLAETRIEEAMEANAFAVLTLARAATDGERHAGALQQRLRVRRDDRSAVYGGGSAGAAERLRRVEAAGRVVRGGDAVALRVASRESVRRRRRCERAASIGSSTRSCAGGPVKVFVDRVVSPSYAWDIVDATRAIIERRPPAGTYHCVNTGAATWYELARRSAPAVGSRHDDRADHGQRCATARRAAEVLRALERQAPRRRHYDAAAGRKR